MCLPGNKEICEMNYSGFVNNEKISKKEKQTIKDDDTIPYVIVNPIFREEIGGGESINLNGRIKILIFRIVF
jgi:hypothetical protein